MRALPDWALGGAALAVGGAALYLYFRGAKGVAKDAVGAVGGVVSGAIEGAGGAFQDITQATFGLEKTNPDKCAADLAAGDKWAASFSCPAGTWLRSLFGNSATAAPAKTTTPATAPGGGVVDSFPSVLDPSPLSCTPTFANPNPCPVAGTDSDWLINWAPSNPVPINSNGATSIVPVAGLRG